MKYKKIDLLHLIQIIILAICTITLLIILIENRNSVTVSIWQKNISSSNNSSKISDTYSFYSNYNMSNDEVKVSQNTLKTFVSQKESDNSKKNIILYTDYNNEYNCAQNEKILINILMTKINQYIGNDFQSIGDIEISQYPNTYFFEYECTPKDFFDAVEYVNVKSLYHVPDNIDNDIVLLNNLDGNPQNKICYVGININILKQYKTEKDKNVEIIKSKIPSIKKSSIKSTLKCLAKYMSSNITYDINYGDLTSAINGKTKCTGYAVMFYAFCKELNIPCDYVRGKTTLGAHAWNRVHFPDDSIRYYDITWYDNNDGFNNTKYLYSDYDFHDAITIYD